MAQHIHPRHGVKSADVALLRQEVGVRGNGINEGLQEDKAS